MHMHQQFLAEEGWPHPYQPHPFMHRPDKLVFFFMTFVFLMCICICTVSIACTNAWLCPKHATYTIFILEIDSLLYHYTKITVVRASVHASVCPYDS